MSAAAGPSQDMARLNEMMRMASQRAALAFGEILNLPVAVQFSQANMLEWSSLRSYVQHEFPAWSSAVHIAFSGPAGGEALFLLPRGNDTALLAAIFEQNPGLQTLEDSRQTILVEIGNVLLNACVGTIANQVGKQVTYQTPVLREAGEVQRLLENSPAPHSPVLQMMSSLGVGGLEISAVILLVLYDAQLMLVG